MGTSTFSAVLVRRTQRPVGEQICPVRAPSVHQRRHSVKPHEPLSRAASPHCCGQADPGTSHYTTFGVQQIMHPRRSLVAVVFALGVAGGCDSTTATYQR